MYKVFINDKPLFFAQKKQQLDAVEKVEFYKYESSAEFYSKISRLQKNMLICLISNRPKESIKDFFKEYCFITAAGGVVQNNTNQLLFIYRNNVWDLPKGKIEKNEDEKTAAVREVEEECGLKGPIITDDLISTYHTYERNGRLYLKKTYWFVMSYAKEHSLVPQIEEGITKVKWVNTKKLKSYIENSYGTIQSVIAEFLIKN